MSLSNSAEAALLDLIFNNTAYTLVGDAGGLLPSSTAGSLYIALHTADPGEAGNQGTSETTYTGYARVAVARSAGGFTRSGTAPTQVANTAAVNFGTCTVGTPTITYFSIGMVSSGATAMLGSGALTTPLSVTPGVTPTFAIGALSLTLD